MGFISEWRDFRMNDAQHRAAHMAQPNRMLKPRAGNFLGSYVCAPLSGVSVCLSVHLCMYICG